MKRREFLKAGAATATVAGAAGVGGLAGSACAGLFDGKGFDVGRIPLPDMDEYIRKVDDGMKRIAEWDRRDDIPETELDKALENDLGKKALRALYMAGMFGDLPDAGQVHPGMQARIERSVPEMDEAVADMVEFLAQASNEETGKLQEFLRNKDNPGMEIAQWFDEVESALGVSQQRRRQTRAFLTHAVSRVKNQSPRRALDEYIGKVEKVAAQAGSVAEIERQLIARMGKEAFFQRQERLARYAALWAQEGVTAEDVPIDELSPVELPQPTDEDAGIAQRDAGVDEPEPITEAEPEREPEQEPSSAQSATDAGPSAEACERIEEELAALKIALMSKEISAKEHFTQTRELRAMRNDQRCAGKPTGTEDLVRFTKEECEQILEAAHDEYNAVLDQRQAGAISYDQAEKRKEEILARKDLRFCKKEKKLKAGRVCLGIGGVTAGISIVLIAIGSSSGAMLSPSLIIGAFLATPAVILLLIGLIMLAVVTGKYADV
jgi:hypothetical protein